MTPERLAEIRRTHAGTKLLLERNAIGGTRLAQSMRYARDVGDLLAALDEARAVKVTVSTGPNTAPISWGEHAAAVVQHTERVVAEALAKANEEAPRDEGNQRMLFVLDEATGIDANYWNAAREMIESSGQEPVTITDPGDDNEADMTAAQAQTLVHLAGAGSVCQKAVVEAATNGRVIWAADRATVTCPDCKAAQDAAWKKAAQPPPQVNTAPGQYRLAVAAERIFPNSLVCFGKDGMVRATADPVDPDENEADLKQSLKDWARSRPTAPEDVLGGPTTVAIPKYMGRCTILMPTCYAEGDKPSLCGGKANIVTPNPDYVTCPSCKAVMAARIVDDDDPPEADATPLEPKGCSCPDLRNGHWAGCPYAE